MTLKHIENTIDCARIGESKAMHHHPYDDKPLAQAGATPPQAPSVQDQALTDGVKIEQLENLNIELPSIAEALDHAGIPNFHRVSPEFYRSGQPKRPGFAKLKEMGIKSVISLREYHSDTRKAEGTGLTLHRISMAAGKLTSEHLIQVLCLIRMVEKPLLLHCWHGSDRTGAIVMAYRIVVEGWTLEQAEAEFLTPCYGHHHFWYKNIPLLLRTTDWDRLKFIWNNWKVE